MKKSVFITGASSGLGLALSKKFASEGYIVGGCSRNNFDSDHMSFYRADVNEIGEISQAIDKFLEEHNIKELNIFIANAGVSHQNQNLAEKENINEIILKTNVLATLLNCDYVLARMRNNKQGSVVLVSSIAGINGLPEAASYCASKAAVRVYAESKINELQGSNVNISCVIPGYIDTPLTEDWENALFKLNIEKAANIIFKGIIKKRKMICFPAILYFPSKLLNILPFFVRSRIISIFNIKV